MLQINNINKDLIQNVCRINGSNYRGMLRSNNRLRKGTSDVGPERATRPGVLGTVQLLLLMMTMLTKYTDRHTACCFTLSLTLSAQNRLPVCKHRVMSKWRYCLPRPYGTRHSLTSHQHCFPSFKKIGPHVTQLTYRHV